MGKKHKVTIIPSKDRKGWRRRHAFLITGADNRGWCLEWTIPIMRKYFDTITVTDTGSTDNTREVCEKNDVNVIDADLDKKIMALQHEAFLDTVPTGEWVYWTDSDEIPSRLLLESLPELQEKAKFLGITEYSFPAAGHWFDEHGELVGASVKWLLKGDTWPIFGHRGVFKKTQFLQKTEHFVIDYNDTHTSFKSFAPPYDGENWKKQHMYMPMHYNHYKGALPTAKSSFILGLSWPDSHSMKADRMKETAEWNALKQKNGYTHKQIASWSANKNTPQEALDMFAGWKDLPKPLCEVYNHIFKYEYDGSVPRCTGGCCSYDSEA